LRWTIGYGYRPFLALIPIIFFVLLGTALFWSGYRRGVLTPVEKDAAEYFEKAHQPRSNPQLIVPSPPAWYQPFNAFFYFAGELLAASEIALGGLLAAECRT
jgi:hypothetical protein